MLLEGSMAVAPAVAIDDARTRGDGGIVNPGLADPPGAVSRTRCPWADSDPLLAAYHDDERGRMPAAEAALFEALSLDVLKGGMPWRDVLHRRTALREAFAGFEVEVVAGFREADVGRIGQALGWPTMRGRIRAVTQNARRLVAARSDWGDGPGDRAAFARWLAATPADAVVADLQVRFRMVSHRVARSFAESVGLVPLGHAPDCWRARAVVFDLDGVILDSEVWWREVREAMLRERGGVWSEEDHRAIMGMSSGEWAAEMVRRKGLAEDPHAVEMEVVARLVRRYERQPPPLIDGAAAAVRSAAALHPIAVASSAHPDAIAVGLRAAGLGSLFEVVLSSDEVARGKPAPDVYVEAARRLALRPSACVAVEDSVNGIRAAVEAGMAAVLVPNPAIPPHADAFGLATAVVDRLADLDADAVLNAFHEANGRTGGGGTMASDAARRNP